MYVAQAVMIREGEVEGNFSGKSRKDFVGAMEKLWDMVLLRAGGFAPASGKVVKLGAGAGAGAGGEESNGAGGEAGKERTQSDE